MMGSAATKDDVLQAIEREWRDIDPGLRSHLSRHLIDPSPSLWKRTGAEEPAFIVARGHHFVVFFDDVEEVFGTAKEMDGRIVNPHFYAGLALALREFEQLEITHGVLC